MALKNLNNKKLFKNNIFKKFYSIKNEKDSFKNLMNFLFNIYAPIKNIKNKEDIKKDVGKLNFSNKAEIIYKMHEKNNINKRIKLFDSVFVQNNKDKLSVEINGIQSELNEYYINDNNEEVLKVTLKELPNKSLTDMSYMFNNCKNLVSVNF